MDDNGVIAFLIVPVVIGLLLWGWAEVDASSACRALCADRGAAVESSGYAACMCRLPDKTLLAVDRKAVPSG